MIFDRGDIVIAPFRFTDLNIFKMRPVLVVSDAAAYSATQHVIAVMITSATRSSWSLDVRVVDWHAAGLAKPCVVRLKLATIAADAIRERIGRLDHAEMRTVTDKLNAVLAGPRV